MALNAMAGHMVAQAMLRGAGGGSVVLTATTASSDPTNTGLGFDSALRYERELEPALVRWKMVSDESRELLIDADTLERALGIGDTETLRSMLLRSQVRTGGETLRVTGLSTEVLEGTVYLYRLKLER